MTAIPFGEVYADQYDLLYGTKDYDTECDLLLSVLQSHAAAPIQKILDLGCGTGNHAVRLAQRGHEVTGVDRSEAMLTRAQRKAAELNVPVRWLQGDIRDAAADGPFDAALFMFAVLGYMETNQDVLRALANVRRQLRPGGLLAFDIWYGPAVLRIGPSDRVLVRRSSRGKLVRTASSVLDQRHHRCLVTYRVWLLEGQKVVAECEETHSMRYFFPMEVELMLEQSGFQIVDLTAFPEKGRPADETTWNAFVVARAV